MNFADWFRYDGKRVLVVGGATGIGAASAELLQALGADVAVMDYAEIKLSNVQKIQLNLADKSSIEYALQQLTSPVNAVFSCAGVADNTPGIECINYVGHVYLIEKLIEQGKLPPNSAVCLVSSSAGLGWEAQLEKLIELFDIKDFDAAAQWLRQNKRATYIGTKQAICAYVARNAFSYLKQGIRLNALCPGPTDTPLAQASNWLHGGTDFRTAAGVRPSKPIDQALPMVFLCSPAASAISGAILVADNGWFNSGLVHSFPNSIAMSEFVLGRKLF